MKRTMQLLISASALCIFACAAGAQQAPPPKTEPPKPKAKRVWTNDDVTSLRQPSDVYEEEKRLKAEEAAAAKTKEKPATGDAAAQKPMSREERISPKPWTKRKSALQQSSTKLDKSRSTSNAFAVS